MSATGIKEPSTNDVLFGRGKAFQNHAGNKLLHKIVDDRLKAYYFGTIKIKNEIIDNIVTIILDDHSGRFLRRNDQGENSNGLWDEVSLDEARGKVGHTIRSRMRSKQVHEKFMQSRSMMKQKAGEKVVCPGPPSSLSVPLSTFQDSNRFAPPESVAASLALNLQVKIAASRKIERQIRAAAVERQILEIELLQYRQQQQQQQQRNMATMSALSKVSQLMGIATSAPSPSTFLNNQVATLTNSTFRGNFGDASQLPPIGNNTEVLCASARTNGYNSMRTEKSVVEHKAELFRRLFG